MTTEKNVCGIFIFIFLLFLFAHVAVNLVWIVDCNVWKNKRNQTICKCFNLTNGFNKSIATSLMTR